MLSNALGIWCLVLMCALVGRLNRLRWKHNAWDNVGMHVGMAIVCAWDGYCGLTDQITPGTLGIILGASCWIHRSRRTWQSDFPVAGRRASDIAATAAVLPEIRS